ncbi:MAG: hypothetical protein ACKV0T_23965 [Planctomycetales bacterium]
MAIRCQWRFQLALAGLAIVALVVAVGVMAFPFVSDPPSQVKARRALRFIWVAAVDDLEIDETQGVIVSDFVGPVEIDGEQLKCPHCGRPFLWYLNPPSGERIRWKGATGSDSVRFYVSCIGAESHIDGMFLFEDGQIELLRNGDVDWIQQSKRLLR